MKIFLGHKLISFISLIFWGSSLSFGETIKLELSEKKFGISQVPVELVLPKNPIKKPFPLIIFSMEAQQMLAIYQME